MFFGSLMLLAAAGVSGEVGALRLSTVTTRSLAGLAYLIVFGSLVAFSAYMWLLKRFSPTLVATHTFVNPIVAVVLAWIVGDEKMSPQTALATVAVIAAVLLVRRGSRAQTALPASIAAIGTSEAD